MARASRGATITLAAVAAEEAVAAITVAVAVAADGPATTAATLEVVAEADLRTSSPALRVSGVGKDGRVRPVTA